MKKTTVSYTLLTYAIALVWLINGVYCKILDFVPRHREIVGEILGHEYARLLTITIGFAEVIMAIWIVTRIYPRFNAASQIGIIMVMNILEFLLVPNLLLWGQLNFAFAVLFCILIYVHGFILDPYE